MKIAILNWILGISGAAAAMGFFFKKYGKKIGKWISLSRDVLDLVDDLRSSMEPEADGSVKITAEELKTFEDGLAALRRDLGITDTITKEIKK